VYYFRLIIGPPPGRKMGWIPGIVSIVGLLTAVAGLLKAYLDVKPLVALRRSRETALTGAWSGRILEPNHPLGYYAGTVAMRLETSGSRVTGKARVVISRDKTFEHQASNVTIELSIKGGFARESILRLDYANSDHSVMQFGTMYLRLDGTGRRLIGRLAGYGNLAEDVIHGDVSLDKQD
jgi:hypothetical protein